MYGAGEHLIDNPSTEMGDKEMIFKTVQEFDTFETTESTKFLHNKKIATRCYLCSSFSVRRLDNSWRTECRSGKVGTDSCSHLFPNYKKIIKMKPNIICCCVCAGKFRAGNNKYICKNCGILYSKFIIDCQLDLKIKAYLIKHKLGIPINRSMSV